MHITFWGAARTVTGSQHLVETAGEQILLDCGLYQGKRANAYAINQTLPFDATRVNAMILSHGHIDHSGNIPNLVKSGYAGDIHCTDATRDLCAVMLRDSGKIQEEDAAFLNRHHKNPHPVEPIYTMDDAALAIGQFTSHEYGRPISVTPNVRVTFSDAGHMLGSTHELIELREGDKQVRLCFSGDLGRAGLPILRDPAPMPEADYLIIESTYGDRLHKPIQEATPDLLDAIGAAYKRGGKVVIPSFAVGRTQDIVYRLNGAMNAGVLPDVPVFVDSPLAVNVTEAFRTHPECYDAETREIMRDDPDGNAFGFRRLKYVHSVEESKALNDLQGPAVIISASGMAEAGRILHHLKNNVEDSRNTILITGFQAPNTLGRRIVEKQKRIKIFGEDYDLRARVESLSGMSGHADRSELIAWAGHFKRPPRQTFLVHGEPDAAFELAERLRAQLGFPQVTVPELGERFTL